MIKKKVILFILYFPKHPFLFSICSISSSTENDLKKICVEGTGFDSEFG